MTNITIRYLTIDDKKAVMDHFLNLSETDRRSRFMHFLSSQGLVNFVNGINFEVGRFFGAFVSSSEKGELLLAAIAQLNAPDTKSTVGEIALSVDERHRKKGLGSTLIQKIIDYAKHHNFTQLNIECLDENIGMKALAAKKGFALTLNKYGKYNGILKL